MNESLWFENLRLRAQHNLNEYDCNSLDIRWWTDYWASLKLEAIVLIAGGFIATHLPLFHIITAASSYKAGGFFGEYSGALRKKGIKAVDPCLWRPGESVPLSG